MTSGGWMAAVGLVLLMALCSAAAPPVNSSEWWSATVSTLETGSATAQQSARMQLIHIGEMTSMPADYPESLNAAMLRVLTTGTPRAKLNAAVVLERVAGKTASPALVPATGALLSDRSEAIALWGIKTARPLIAAGGAPAATLAPKVVNAFRAHPDSGPIAEESYAALLPDGPLQPAVVQALLTVLEARVAAYGNGAIPPSPGAEERVPAYLSVTCWRLADQATQKRILTDLGSLTLATANTVADGNTDRTVLEMARLSANAVESIGTQLHDDALIMAAKALEDIQPGKAGEIPAKGANLDAAFRVRGILLPANR